MKRSYMLMAAVVAVLSIVACKETYVPSSEEQQNAAQEQANKQAVQQVGFPTIVNYQEKRVLKDIYELRDTTIRTYAYTQDMMGKYHKLCDSVGYGIPADTQFTNPQQVASGDYREAITTVAQADPNGLYSGPTQGTWVLCNDPTNPNKTVPVYSEPNLIVSPFPLVQG